MKTVSELLADLRMPQDCIDTLAACTAIARQRAGREFSSALEYFMNGDADRPTAAALLSALSEKAGLDPRQSDMTVVLSAFALLEEKYETLGLPRELYENACRDAGCKLRECRSLYGVWGTFVPGWFLRFFVPSRFALGRFQFETGALNAPGVRRVVFDGLPDGQTRTVCSGDPIIRIHIPSTGEPITDELRTDAYRRAYAFYKDRFADGLVPFSCRSWLLYDRHPDFLPEASNILRFMRDFCILPCPYEHVFGDLWRIFPMSDETPFELLPEDTSLRRAYKRHLLAGGTPGECVGLFLFDGERIYCRPRAIEPERPGGAG